MKRTLIGAAILSVLCGCDFPWPPNPQPTPTPTPAPTPTPWECELPYPGCHEYDPPLQCSSDEQPCWHNPTDNPNHCEEAPKCDTPPPELPEPQCPTFTDRGGTFRPRSEACDCYFGQAWVPCEGPPECGFPQGVPNSDFTGVENPGTYGSVVNSVMADLTGCAVGTDCPITFGPDPWMKLVCDEMCKLGFNCGRHDNEPPGATDQISVIKGSFCDGRPHENYQIYNYGGKKVRWAPGGQQDGWVIDPNTPACRQAPPTPPPPSNECPAPHPSLTAMKFNTHEKGNHLDTTWITNYQPDFCASIGYCCMPGTGTPPNTCDSPGCVPRGGCPVRPDGHPDRSLCEAELCDQKWTCNGEPYPGWRGNPAQTDCEGLWVTWCDAPGSTARAEGFR